MPASAPKVRNAFGDAFGDADEDGGVHEETVEIVKKTRKKQEELSSSSEESDEEEKDEEEDEKSSSSESDEESDSSSSDSESDEESDEDSGDESDEEDSEAEEAEEVEESDEEIKEAPRPKPTKRTGPTIAKPTREQRKAAKKAKKKGKVFAKAAKMEVVEKKKKKQSKLEKAISYKDSTTFEDLTAGLPALVMETYEKGLIVTLAKSLEQDRIPLNRCVNCLQKFLDDEYVATVLTRTMVEFHERSTKIKVLDVIKASNMSEEVITLMMVGQDGEVHDFLEKHGLVFIKPVEDLMTDVVAALEGKTKASKIVKLIDDKVGESAFPVELIPGVVGFLSSKMYADKKPSAAIISTVSPLLERCVRDDQALQAKLLFEFQGAWFASKPRDNGFIKVIFKTLYEEELVEPLAFNLWRETKNSILGKKNALLKVNFFISEIQPPPEPEESDEEDDEEEVDFADDL